MFERDKWESISPFYCSAIHLNFPEDSGSQSKPSALIHIQGYQLCDNGESKVWLRIGLIAALVRIQGTQIPDNSQG